MHGYTPQGPKLKTKRPAPVAQTLKNPPAKWETWVQSLGWEDTLEKGMATHSRILAWRISWTQTRLSDFHLSYQHINIFLIVINIF